MPYNTKDLVNFATSKNAVDFTTALNNILASKVHDRIVGFQEDMCKNIYKTGYEPHNSDEERFMDKHIPSVVDYPVDNENGLPFKDDSMATSGKTPASYDKGEDEEVYEATSSMKLIKTHSAGNKTAKVYKDYDWNEYRVKHFIGGKHQKNADYHTDDADDAHTTAKKFIKENETIEERKLTKAEMSKREEIAQAIAKKFPKMEMGKKMAIATAQAKKSA